MLWNIPRQRKRQAWTAKEGFDLATGRGQVPLSYFEAVAETTTEAAEMAYSFNTARREKEALAKLRGGGSSWQ